MPEFLCPSEARLGELLVGQGNPGDLDAFAAHLEGCPDCRRRAERFDRHGDPLLQDLRRASETVHDDEPAPARHTGVGTPPADVTIDHDGTTENHQDSAQTQYGHAEVLGRGAIVRYFGDYEIQEELGRGGMGVVYMARQISLNRPVALKMIKAGIPADAHESRRFQNAAEAVALLDHPGIVPIFEVGEHDRQRYFTMKLIEGGSLGEQLPKFGGNYPGIVALMIEMAEALDHAHRRGILHRDLKPANILLDRQGRPHIGDFGLSKRVESDVEMTQSGAILGTPAYMSPEQTVGRRGSITTSSDVYGLGAILYALLTGAAPFGGDSIIETIDAVRNQSPILPTRRNPKVPRDLELICLKCLAKEPTERYLTAAALVADLRRFAAGEPVSGRAAGAIERAAKWARRKPTLAAAYALSLLVMLLGSLGGVAIWQWRDAERARDAAELNGRRAEKDRGIAEEARIEATKSQAEAVAQKKRVERLEYARSMEIAHQEWYDNKPNSSLSRLEQSPADLRGWEWHYLNRLCHSDLHTLSGHSVGVGHALFSPDGKRILTASERTAKIWDVETGALIHTLQGHTQAIQSASFSPDGSSILTGSEDNTGWTTRPSSAM